MQPPPRPVSVPIAFLLATTTVSTGVYRLPVDEELIRKRQGPTAQTRLPNMLDNTSAAITKRPF